MLTYPSPPTTPSPVEACSPENRLGHVLNDQYELISVLGVGAYGTVYKARNIHTHAEYAIKALNKLGLDQRQRTFQEREISLHHRASRHDNVVSLVQILESNDCTFVVLEYCPEGDLFAKITEEGHYTGDDFKAKCVFLQIIDAIRHCHSKGIFHRDLKPENILVKDNGWTMKLADFGLATQDRVSSDFGCGSTFYMSPECQTPDPQPYTCYASAPNDVWALGVILVNLTCGRNPWKRASMEDSTFRAYMHDRNFLQTILPISNQINYILQRIFEVDPSCRITLAELRELVVCCTSLTQGSSALPTQRPGQLATPPQSACGSPISFGDISPIDLLPTQQYPIANNYPITFNMPPTPPASNGNSPVLMPHDTQQKRQALRSRPRAVAAPTSWTRCGQVISQLNNLPRASCLWNNLPLY